MKIAEVCNVDFSLRHFVLPVMRGARMRGHEVVGLCAEGRLLDLPRQEGFRIIPVPMARSLNPVAQWRAYRALLKIFREEKFDLVHAHMPISGLLARAAARRAGVKRVAYTGHGFLFNQPGPWWRRKLALGLEQLGGRATDVFMTVSEEEAADARCLGIHPRAVGIGNGRDPFRFRPDAGLRAGLRAELGAAEDDCVVVIVSRLVRHKGHVELLRAMEAVPGATLWVVGERLPTDHGPDMAEDFARAERVLGPRLKRLGYREDVGRILAAADVFCLPSHFEGLPMSVIEAMMTGLPVVATDIRGPREQVRDGDTGFLVPAEAVEPLAAALNRLSGDPPLRQRMGRAGRALALEKFDEDKVVGRTLDLMGL
ncbi:glycosyltransferase family 4 protein [Pseudoroseomonas globiformis]|uniref:Glycosyltransferase family 4 protein n=1 Tax=Teichococcus globiformis TaxID=2307229 RepID=A0ABV7FZB9_9PROT